MSLVDIDSGSRLTCDRDLLCVDSGGRSLSLDSVILESKSESSANPFDRWLWSEGVRPLSFSKYSTALAALRPDLPSNKWHRTIRTHLATPEGPLPGSQSA